MASKSVDQSEVKLGPGWMSLGRKTRNGAPPSMPPSASTTVLPRVRYTKAELLEVYEPGAPPGLPPNMTPHTGITSVDALVPVNIAADDDLQDILHSSAQSPPGRVKPRGSPRSTTAPLTRNRFASSSLPPSNGRSRIASDNVDPSATADTVNYPSEVHKNPINTALSSVPSSSAPHNGSTTLSATTSTSIASSAPLSSSSQIDSSSHAGVSTGGGGATKRPGQVSSSRDFWSGSAVLAPAERPLGANTGERRPLALKPRSGIGANSENSGSDGGTNGASSSSDQYGRSSQQGSGPYWSRAGPRGAADSNSNWRGGPSGGNSSSNSSFGAASGNDSGPVGSTATASAPTSSNVGVGSSHSHSSRGGFGRETRDAFTRNKEALKPTNTRDLSALAKGSNREQSGTSTSLSSHFTSRDRENRATAPIASAAEKVQPKNSDPVSDSNPVWFYKDPKNETQGPFTGAQIMQWLKECFYDEELLVSRNRESNYRPLAVAFGLRKEDSAPAPPPGFVSGSSNDPAPSPATVSASIAPRGSARSASGNPSRIGRDDRREERRDDRSRRGQLTVEEMAHEVEMMRLEARNKRKAAAPSLSTSAIDSDVETRRLPAEESLNANTSATSRLGLADENISSRTKPAKGPLPSSSSGFGLSDAVDTSGTSDRSMGVSPLSDSPGGLPSRSTGTARIPSALHESDLLSKINGTLAASPVARSRFASIMSSSTDARKDSEPIVPVSITLATGEAPSGEHRLASAVRGDMPGASARQSDATKDPRIALPSLPGVVEDTGRLQFSTDGAVAQPSHVPRSSVQPQQPEKLSQSQQSEASWGTMMGDPKEQKNPQAAVSQMPRMAVAAAEHDLMALDPAIARASFSRRPAPTPPSSSTLSIPSFSAAPQPWAHSDGKGQKIGSRDIADSSGGIQSMSHSQASSQSVDEAYAKARALAQAQAQAKALAEAHAHAQAQAMARHAQAQAQAQAQARAQVQAQRQAQAQVQAQAQAGSQAQTQDPAWLYRHRLGQLQSAWDMHCRGQMDVSRTLQLARTTAAQHVPGSAEHQRAMMFISNSEAAYNEHTRNMEQIKQAAQHTNMLLLRHQQQQQQQLIAQQQFSQQLSRQQHVGPQQQMLHQQQMAQLQSQKPQTVGIADQTPGQHAGKSSAVAQYQLSQAEIKEGAGEPRTDAVLDKERNSAASSISDLHSALEQSKPFGDGGGNEKPGVLPLTPRSDNPMTTEPSSEAKSVVNKGEESGWERVDRKPRNVSDPPVPRILEADAVLGQVSERTSGSAAASFSADVPRAPSDTHVLVISADKDPRKLEAMAALGQRETDEAEAMRRKAATIPAPWVKATPSGDAQNGLSLREIQRQEELRNKAQIAQAQSMMLAQREEAARQAAARQASISTAPWGTAASVKQSTLSLREQMRLEEEQKQRMAKQNVGATSVSAPRVARAPGSQVQSGTPWASLVASSKPNVPRQTSTGVGKRMGEEGSFWDTVGSAAGKRTMSSSGPSAVNNNARATIARPPGSRQAGNPQARATRAAPLQPQQSSQQTQRASRQTASEPTILSGRVSAEFAKWCAVQLQALTGNDSQDNTFVEYLVSIKSASEIRDTVVQNLGSSDASRAFADEFIRRVEFEKSSESMDHGAGTGGNRKKGRRQRANKVDPSLVLGFTSTSSSSRIMQGTIEKPSMD